jgi:hypothetical protein
MTGLSSSPKDQNSRRPASYGFSVYFFCFLLLAVIAFGVGELLARILGYRPYLPIYQKITVEPGGHFYRRHPTLGYAHLPGRFRVTLQDGYVFHVTHASDGLRITHPPAAGNMKTRPAIWIFGCSLTHGWSLNDEETYPWLLQKRFPEYEFVNFGVGGYGTLHSLIQLQEALKSRRKPELIIVAYASFHDLRSLGSRAYQKGNMPHVNYLGSEVVSVLKGRLGAGNKLTYKIVKPDYAPLPLMDHFALLNCLDRAYNLVEIRLLKGQELSKAIFREISLICQKQRIVLVVAGLTQNRKTADLLQYCRNLGMFATDASVDFTLPGNNNWPHDSHPSAKANRQYAQKIGDFLLNKVSLKEE